MFDASGKYLYFLGSTDTGMSKHGFMQSSGDSRTPRWSLHLVVLEGSLLAVLKETDEEKGEMPKTGSETRLSVTMRATEAQSAGSDEPKKVDKNGNFTIDFEGLDQRILSFPIPPGSYSSFKLAPPGQVLPVEPRAES